MNPAHSGAAPVDEPLHPSPSRLEALHRPSCLLPDNSSFKIVCEKLAVSIALPGSNHLQVVLFCSDDGRGPVAEAEVPELTLNYTVALTTPPAFDMKCLWTTETWHRRQEPSMYLDKDKHWSHTGAVGHWLAICLIRIDEKDTIMHFNCT